MMSPPVAVNVTGFPPMPTPTPVGGAENAPVAVIEFAPTLIAQLPTVAIPSFPVT